MKATLPDTFYKRGNPDAADAIVVVGSNYPAACGIHRSRVGLFSKTRA
jgi:hypothetical protein